jgi:hypothetical protein
MATTNWTCWHTLLAERAQRPIPDVTPPTLPPEARAALAHTLAVFQLGETGEGRVAHEVRAWQHPALGDTYADTLRLFVAEEGRHARILGRAVRALGGAPLRKDAGHALFARARRAGGVPFEILVLLAAEVVALAAYDAIATATDGSPLAATLREICADEEDHLELHAAFFRDVATTPAERAALAAAWWAIAPAALAAVSFGHARTWSRLGASPWSIQRVGLRRAADAARRAGFGPALAAPLRASASMT